ncbi:MAG TPA: PepSY domain-containing protein, partial [Hyphomicrobium sp.]|nr:PepSY domain-containing protein [Hyphomicrobium sp.]
MEQAVRPRNAAAYALRSITRQIHLWLGLSAGLILALVGLSGAGLVFAEQMVRSETPSFFA